MVLVTRSDRPAPTHIKKRHGAHHRSQSKHYAKTYWPYLTMFAVIITGFLCNALWTPGRQVLGYATDVSATSLLQHTNMARHDKKERPLTANTSLNVAAQAKAEDMVKKRYWSHETPEGKKPWYFVQQSGYDFASIGENLAYGFDGAGATINAWMNSSEHRANMLSPSYREVGFGIAQASDYLGQGPQTIVVALYAKPAGINTPGLQQSPNRGQVLPMRTVSRVETISTTNAAIIAISSALTAASVALFVTLKHARILRRNLVKGEVFIIKHHLLDVILLVIGAFGFVVTRSAGVIH